ncbi:ABC transporter ATP-binding protein [Ornithinimicrobium cavernae]|uniref:ABC transporter ATP-binding protein n=1 Tax=Ornithinimicrobium cavernae TaxID=2666047 RepID=UPI00137B34C1|nr:ABC transporter ATP-binding protein [Ornithinimicrobium cavernae]
MSLLSSVAVSAGYGDLVAIDNITIDVEENSLLGVIGPNGAGKSTFLRALTGVVPLRGGQVLWQGTDIGHLPADARARKGISMVQEGRRLFPSLTVRDNLELGGFHASRQERAERMTEVVDLFPALGGIMDRSASVLSGGEQQMVALGRALMARPQCLLVDEPSLGLAPLIVDEIYEALPTLIERGMSVVLVEQEVDRVLEVADSLVVLHEGRIVYLGDGSEFRENPDSLAAVYLGHALDEGAA